jgi:hypothetical protein
MMFLRRFLYALALLVVSFEKADAQGLSGLLALVQSFTDSPLFPLIVCPILSQFGLDLALCDDSGDDDGTDDGGPSPPAPTKTPPASAPFKKGKSDVVAAAPVAVPTPVAAAPAL